jgi:DNA-binding NarL/FixJ family response regulator
MTTATVEYSLMPATTSMSTHRSRTRIGYRRERPMWGVEALTPAELRVARLAADGLSNPEIAATVSVTRGTVECQLHSVFQKLGIDSRLGLQAELESSLADVG